MTWNRSTFSFGTDQGNTQHFLQAKLGDTWLLIKAVKASMRKYIYIYIYMYTYIHIQVDYIYIYI